MPINMTKRSSYKHSCKVMLEIKQNPHHAFIVKTTEIELVMNCFLTRECAMIKRAGVQVKDEEIPKVQWN